MRLFVWKGFPFARPAAALLALSMPTVTVSSVLTGAQNGESVRIVMSGTMYILPNGNARVAMKFNFEPPRGYDRIKSMYPNLYVLFRDFGVGRSSYEINRKSLEVASDDGERSISFKGDVYGAVACRNGNWMLDIPKDERIVTRVENRIYTTAAKNEGENLLITGKYEYRLPPEAKLVEYAPDRQQLSYTLPIKRTPGKPSLDVHLRAKKRLMASVYKIYSDPEADDGAYWVGKLVVQNTGSSPIYDLRISYRLGEYTEESLPKVFSIVPPTGAAVDAWYPILSSRVAQLRTRTPTELRVRYDYRDVAGVTHTDQVAGRVEILGINQFEFSNLSDEDRTDSWFDAFNNAPLVTAFITKNDEPVRQFAGIVSDASGGAAAALRDEDAKKWLKASYEQQMKNGIVYQTPADFLTVDRSGGQELKFPRDVFRDRSGTCIDLAITYATLAESVGLHSYLVLMPGHCFSVVRLPQSGTMVPVENTAFGQPERAATFEQAIEAAAKKFAEARQDGRFYLVDVGKLLSEGRVANPELPPLPSDFLDKAGYKRRR